jgi:hypothetical protein
VTTALAINDKNMIAGNYVDTQSRMHAFVGPIDGAYTTFDYLGETAGTWATGIDDKGNVTGIAKVLNGGCDSVPFERNSAGQISTIRKGKKDLGGAVRGGSHGVFTGLSCDKKGNPFYFDERKAKAISTFSLPINATWIVPTAVNAEGAHVGLYYDSNKIAHGFIYKDGTTQVFDYPDPSVVDTFLTGLNDKGVAVGYWDKGAQETSKAFTLNISTGKITALKATGVSYIVTYGMNNAGLVAIQSSNGPFIYCPDGANCPGGGK